MLSEPRKLVLVILLAGVCVQSAIDKTKSFNSFNFPLIIGHESVQMGNRSDLFMASFPCKVIDGFVSRFVLTRPISGHDQLTMKIGNLTCVSRCV